MADVVVVCWPQERTEVDRLARQSVPRLLLVEPDALAPVTEDVLQDWIRLPADHRELATRLATLRRRAEAFRAVPCLDRHGRLAFRGRWITVTPTEERLLARLAHRFDGVVPEAELRAAAWPRGTPTANAVRVTFHRLLVRVRPLGLDLRRVHDGWILQARDDDLQTSGVAP